MVHCAPIVDRSTCQSGIKHKTMTHRCRDYPKRPMYSIRKRAVMESTKLPNRAWAVGIYLFTTNIKGVSSMISRRELGIGQRAALFMLARLRKAAEIGTATFCGPVEADETYMGGKMPKAKREALTAARSGRKNSRRRDQGPAHETRLREGGPGYEVGNDISVHHGTR